MEAKGFIGKILVPIDGSVSSIMAEETAARIAPKTQATVTVLQVMQELKLGSPLPKNVEKELSDHVEQEAEKIISDARALFADEGITVDATMTRKSNPAD